jgi:hypothetical protein
MANLAPADFTWDEGTWTTWISTVPSGAGTSPGGSRSTWRQRNAPHHGCGGGVSPKALDRRKYIIE